MYYVNLIFNLGERKIGKKGPSSFQADDGYSKSKKNQNHYICTPEIWMSSSECAYIKTTLYMMGNYYHLYVGNTLKQDTALFMFACVIN